MTIICYFTAISQQTKKAVTTNKCASAMGHFDSHDDAPVRCRAHLPIKHVPGYLRSHWTPPWGDYLPRIALVNVLVFDSCVKKQVVAV